MGCPDCEDARQDLAGCEADAEELTEELATVRGHLRDVLEQVANLRAENRQRSHVIDKLDQEIAMLRRWKAEAIEVLKRWDALADNVEAELGAPRSDAVAAHITRLETALRRVVESGAYPEAAIAAEALDGAP